MIKKSLYLALPLALSILLSGCGSSSDDNNNDDETPTATLRTYTGVFNAISNSVEIAYTCGTKTGILKDDGLFTFEEGENCTFTYGDSIQTIDASELVDGVSIDENPTTTARSDLEKILLGNIYYSVQPKDTRVIVLNFEEIADRADGKFYVWASFGGVSLNTYYEITDNILTIPSRELTLTFIKQENDYLLFEDDRRMYLDKTKAEAFVAANK